jgi:hypothetical protein
MPRCVSVESLLVIVYLGVFLSIKTVYYFEIDFGDELGAFDLGSAVNTVDDCNLPDYKPFHPSVKEFLKDPPPLNCGKWHFPLTFVDSKRAIYVNASAVAELKKYNASVQDVKCFYKSISRAFNESEGHDDTVDFSEDEVILFDCPL